MLKELWSSLISRHCLIQLIHICKLITYQAPRRKGGTNYLIRSYLHRWNDIPSFTVYIQILLLDSFHYTLFHCKSFMGFHMVCQRSHFTNRETSTARHKTNLYPQSEKTQTVAPSLLSPPTSERCWVLRRSALNILWLQYFYVLVWFSSGFNFLDFSQINWFFSLSCTVGFVFCYVFCFILFFRCALSYPPLFIILYSVENELALTEFFGNTSDNFSELQGKSWRLTPSRHS